MSYPLISTNPVFFSHRTCPRVVHSSTSSAHSTNPNPETTKPMVVFFLMAYFLTNVMKPDMNNGQRPRFPIRLNYCVLILE